MKIYFNNTELDLLVNDNSYRYRAIKGEHSLTLYYSLAQHVEIPIGAYCMFENERYTLEKPENFKMHNTRNFEYTLIMDSSQEKLKKYKFKDTTSRRLKFSLTAQPQEHLKMLVDNLNQREPGWTVGECISAVEKVISYNHAYCSDVLTQMADAFETEWEIVGKKISLRKVEYNKENPLPLSYGRGNGFKSGVGRTNHNDSKPIEILFVQGGERNINASTYGSSELLLPKNQTLEYEGRTYVSDSDGFSIRRADKSLSTQAEDSLDCSHIYPSRVGSVSSVEVVDADKHFYDFFDLSIPENLNFRDCRIPGEKMTVIFQSGMLTGKEFDIEQTENDITGYIHSERRFKLVPQEIDGRTMPDEVFRPFANDKYAVFGISLPEAYVCNDADKTGASWDMFRESAKFLYENEGNKFTFTGELDGIWSKKDWINIGGRIKLGGYILFSDNQFQPNGVNIRIVGIKDYINNPHSPVIELSNEVVGSSISSDLLKIESNEVVVDSLHRDAISFTKRRFRDAVETGEMLVNALLKNFTGSITPITVRTMQVLLGDESLQYRFVNNKTNPVTVSHVITYDESKKVLKCPAGIVQHMTLGIKNISSRHDISTYKFWDVAEFNSPTMPDTDAYYLYIKASKTAQTASFVLSKTAIEMEAVSGFYHFLVGVLNSEFDGSRSFVELYGFTEILPGRITTDRVVSADGLNFLDFVNNAFRVGNNTNYLEWNRNGDGKLRLKGTIVQSDSGDENFIGVFRGEYNSTYVYYPGDEVTYTSNGGTSTYRYIYATPTKGNVPTNATYWIVIASKGSNGKDGEDGEDGQTGSYTSFVFRQSKTQPAKPTGTNPIPTDWQDAPTNNSVNSLLVSNVSHSGSWTWQPDGTRRSSAIGHNEITKSRISFTTTANNATLVIQIKVSSESGYDFCLVGLLDNNAVTRDSNYTDRISGETTKTVSINVPTAGSHYIEIAYAKDVSQVSGSDCCFYKVLEGIPWWLSSALISYIDGVWKAGAWSTPVKITDGTQEYRYMVAASKPTKPSGLNPSGWYTAPPEVPTGYYLWMSCCEKNAEKTAIITDWSEPVRISGEKGSTGDKGDTGTTGDYYEYRYAVNGSRTTYPSLSVTSVAPSGWSISMPSVGSLQYLWCTVAKKSAAGALLQNWSTPTRVTGYDGQDGAPGAKGDTGPTVVFRGLYNSSAIYYGTSKRVDCVKYNNIYYVARVDAGDGFINKVPTNMSYWNDFGAQFDSIATNLLLAEGANIGDWFMSGGKIVSTLSGNNKITLDASMARILIESTTSGGDYSLDYSPATMRMDAISGVFEARNNNGVAYISPSGVFCNNPKTNALPSSSGYRHYGSIVGLGYAKNINNAWSFGGNDTIVAGVYGRADNTGGDAPAFGGYFADLFAQGLILNRKYISGSANSTNYIYNGESFVLSFATAGIQTIYLPSDGMEGKIVILKQLNGGRMRVYPYPGQKLFDDSTENTYLDITEGQMAICMCFRGVLSSVAYKIWSFNKFSY